MIKVSPVAANRMIEHVTRCYPNEGCGILLGSGSEVTDAVACRNVYPGDQRDRFEISAADILSTQREARQTGLEVIGFFHSHPDADAYFSGTDVAHASPWHTHIVLSVRDSQFCTAKAFRVDLDLTFSKEEELSWPR